jgi:hypothetical protein
MSVVTSKARYVYRRISSGVKRLETTRLRHYARLQSSRD